MQRKRQGNPGKQQRFLAGHDRTEFEETYLEHNLAINPDMEDLVRKTANCSLAAFIAEPMKSEGGLIAPLKESYPIVAESIPSTEVLGSATKFRPACAGPAEHGSASTPGRSSPI